MVHSLGLVSALAQSKVGACAQMCEWSKATQAVHPGFHCLAIALCSFGLDTSYCRWLVQVCVSVSAASAAKAVGTLVLQSSWCVIQLIFCSVMWIKRQFSVCSWATECMCVAAIC